MQTNSEDAWIEILRCAQSTSVGLSPGTRAEGAGMKSQGYNRPQVRRDRTEER
jgi:hypothetical protein